MPPVQKAADQKHCGACGTIIHNSAPVCPKCGAVQAGGSGLNKKSRTTAIVFALLLGGLGVHKFYLGSPILGIIYLVFCWTFIPAIVALIEGIHYATMNDEQFAAKFS